MTESTKFPTDQEFTLSAHWVAEIWSVLNYYAGPPDKKLSESQRRLPASLARQNLEILLGLSSEQLATIRGRAPEKAFVSERAFGPTEYLRYSSYLTTMLNQRSGSTDVWAGLIHSGVDPHVELLCLGTTSVFEVDTVPVLQTLFLEWSASKGLHCFKNAVGTITVNFRDLRDKVKLS